MILSRSARNTESVLAGKISLQMRGSISLVLPRYLRALVGVAHRDALRAEKAFQNYPTAHAQHETRFSN
jgi:hypothetical protein